MLGIGEFGRHFSFQFPSIFSDFSFSFATDLDEEFNQKDLEETSFDRIILFVEIVRKNLGGGNVEF